MVNSGVKSEPITHKKLVEISGTSHPTLVANIRILKMMLEYIELGKWLMINGSDKQ